ncbi:hypothetical protein C8F04DRAFT_1264074 [Mycena alexandri]|uniref:CxC2-like cysteine cluster KDZ transposase-associated domain-containing protein n=1 Tax=Mycena alexandri TaxID=1745969 RepID=A0AAD6WWS3_9AGAR|nr:hypothetical protein C8F04DRAFT_1264074 [Mycena alexandri]
MSKSKGKKRSIITTDILEYSLEDVFGEGGPSFTSQSISGDADDFDDLTAPPPILPSEKPVKARAKRYLSSDATLKQFIPLVDEYLAEFLRLEGKGNVAREWCPACPKNRVANPAYRCTHPLDRIEVWNGEFFERVTLKSLGLRIQMGHTGFETCDSPQPGHTDFTVIHTNGIHPVAVDFCGCERAHVAGTTREQTLRRSWFPATDLEPQTCATFRCVELFHILTLQGKVTTYDFYSGLEKVTDNTGLVKIKDRYKSFMRVMREWRHLVMVKRSGVGNDGKRKVADTRPGELGPDCLGCPRPKVNIPDGWEFATGEERFLYILFIAIDTCFRLKRRLVSSERKDPSLGPGWSFFTEDVPYREYLLGVTDQKEMSTCSGLAALDYANTKFSRGYGSTGKGERYANMDYIFASLMRHHDQKLLKFISYDICCQWSKHLLARLKKLPAKIQLTLILALVRFLIPKLHIYGHKIQCQLYFSLNYTPGSARTDGEGIERPWANIGPVATSTREMGPGSRQDILNDHWSHWNWQKLVGLSSLLKKRLLNAIPERNFQAESLATFTANQIDNVPQWKAVVEAFEADSTKPNPYEIPKSGALENDVRLECAEEEAAEQRAGVPAIHNVSPSAFILAGLDLEEQQRQIKIEVLTRKGQTTKQSAELVEKHTKLSRYIARFRTLQIAYTPAALQALADRAEPAPDMEEEAARVENVPLFLPSALTEEHRATGCNRGVVGIKTCLRDAQCRSALDEIRNLLHVKSRFRTYKGGNKLRSYAEKYVAAWEAKRRLAGEANVGWRRLNPMKDLRCMESEDDAAIRSRRKVHGKKRTTGAPAMEEERREGVQEGQRGKGHASEGRRMVSWIWMGIDSASPGTSETILTGLRAEWAKAWARTRRWTEEVKLLKEEMRRVPVALRWKANWWRERRDVEEFSGGHAEGARAYASRQAALMESIADRFELMWEGLHELEEVPGEMGERERQQDDEERDDEDEHWVVAESEGEGGIEGEDEEGSVGEPDEEGEEE